LLYGDASRLDGKEGEAGVRIAIIAPGSRGDVQPYIALGKGLQDAGHDVRIVTNLEFEPLVRSYGLGCLSVAFGVRDAFQDPGTRAAIGSGKVLASFAKLADIPRRSSRMLAECGLEACGDVDGILAGFEAASSSDTRLRRS
jgi:hypothetical protein